MDEAHPHIIRDLEELRAESPTTEKPSTFEQRLTRPGADTIKKIGGPAAQAVLTYAEDGLQWGVRMNGNIYTLAGRLIGDDPHPADLIVPDESHEEADPQTQTP